MTTTFHYSNLDTSEEDNYSKLLSWYLTSLDSGAFEELTMNISKARRLDRFITTHSKHYDSIVLILLLPTVQIKKSPNLLENLLNKFYDDGLDHTITITPMGCVEDLDATILMIKDDNDSKTTTNSTNILISQKNFTPQSLDVNSILSGESGYTPSEYSKVEHTQNGTYLANDISRTSIGVNDDFDSGSDSDSQSDSGMDSIKGEPLSRVSTVEEIDSQAITHPVVQITSQYGESDSLLEDQASLSSASRSTTLDSLIPFPTQVSTMTTMSHTLVLKSILFKSYQDGEKKTAIRQFGNGKMSDDWLLYDDEFSLDNLQLLTLSEILEVTKLSGKVLFYSLDSGDLEIYGDSDDEIAENDLTVTEFNGLGDDLTQPIRYFQSNTTLAATPALSKTSTIRTNHDSIRSEYVIHKPDTTYSSIQKSKSVPISMKNKIKRKNMRRYNDKSCIIV